MIIRCPHCDHSRRMNLDKVPPTAEVATCPKCGNKFRFRTIRPEREPESPQVQVKPSRPAPQLYQQQPVLPVETPQPGEKRSSSKPSLQVSLPLGTPLQRSQQEVRQSPVPDRTEVSSVPHTPTFPSYSEPKVVARAESEPASTVLEAAQSDALPSADNFTHTTDGISAVPEAEAHAHEPESFSEAPPAYDAPTQATVSGFPEYPVSHQERTHSSVEPPSEQNDIWDALENLNRKWENDNTPIAEAFSMPSGMQGIQTPSPAERPEPAGYTSSITSEVVSMPSSSEEATEISTTEVLPSAQPQVAGSTDLHAPASSASTVHPIATDNIHPMAEQPIDTDSVPPTSVAPYDDLQSCVTPLPNWLREDSRPVPSSDTTLSPYRNVQQPLNPELKAELGVQMLREASATVVTRDLGILSDLPPLGAPSETVSAVSGDTIPWENPSRYGWLRGFFETVHGVMLRGPSFFKRFTVWGSLGPGYLFFLLIGYLAVLSCLVWSRVALRFFPDFPMIFPQHVSLPILLLIAPIALGLMLLFITGTMRILTVLFSSEKIDFTLVYKVAAYSVAPLILSIVPFVGPVIGALWFIVALMTGCRYALGLSWQLAIIVPLPTAALLLGGIGWFFL